MEREAKSCLDRFHHYDYRWLTFSGPTEVGKTHILKQLKSFFLKHQIHPDKLSHYDEVTDNYLIYRSWYYLMEDFTKGRIDMRQIRRCGILMIEDFLSNPVHAYANPNTYVTIEISRAYEILNERQGKPTIIDTNKSINEIQNIDPRIASRLLREDSVFVDIPNKTQGYLSRNASSRK